MSQGVKTKGRGEKHKNDSSKKAKWLVDPYHQVDGKVAKHAIIACVAFSIRVNLYFMGQFAVKIAKFFLPFLSLHLLLCTYLFHYIDVSINQDLKLASTDNKTVFYTRFSHH